MHVLRVFKSLDSLKQFFGLERKATLAVPDAALLDLFGAAPAASGVLVTPFNAMRCAAVRCAVLAISEAVGQLPAQACLIGDDGAELPEPSHPVSKLLGGEVNEFTASSDFIEQLTRDALLFGNGYAFINKVNGKPIELNRFDPTRETMLVQYNTATGVPVYQASLLSGATRTFQHGDIFHLKAPGLNGIVGDSPVILGREAIGLAIVMEAHAARLFGNGARPSGVLTAPGKLSPPEATRMKSSWQAAQVGTNGTAVLEGGTTWQQLTLSSVDAQFLELWKHSVTEIARIYRIPPDMLMEMGRATWKNSEEGGRRFINYAIMPWIMRWRAEARLKLFSAAERDRYALTFDTDGLVISDLNARAEACSKLIAARVFNPNEARAAFFGMSPYVGGERFINPNVTNETVDVGR